MPNNSRSPFGKTLAAQEFFGENVHVYNFPVYKIPVVEQNLTDKPIYAYPGDPDCLVPGVE